MSASEIFTSIAGQKIKLTNLDKVLYPAAGITKAEIIQYYLSVADYMLPLIKDRPLTLIRNPDGIDKKGFYGKTKPTWTPDWMPSFEISHSEESIDYLVADQKASLAWIANLAGLEMHPMQFTRYVAAPDSFIFDLDPPEKDYSWERIQEIAFKLKVFLKRYDYPSFIKTSGSKGLHIFVPIETKYTHEQMVHTVKTLGSEFVNENAKDLTLRMNKDRRQGKMLLDIFRNHKGHTTVAPFSLRAKPNAPISMPIFWNDLEEVHSAKAYHIRNGLDYLKEKGNAWAKIYKEGVPLHDHRKTQVAVSEKDRKKLKAYNKKRNFDLTEEPKGETLMGADDEYVIQLHDASRLHYDLRLEQEGVLWSWAIPKGLPHHTGVKRLAIRTEDHPIKYLDYEGVIPKGEYGAGEMWIFSRAKYQIDKKEVRKIYFTLNANEFNRSYRIYNTEDNQWLIERTDASEKLEFVKPMLAASSKKLLDDQKYSYEVKWDGIRVVIVLNDDELQVYSRSGREITKQFPELVLDRKHLKASNGIFDGELVCLDEQGRPLFSQIISRMHQSGGAAIKKASTIKPVYCYLFDCINLEGKDICQEPLERRRAWTRVVIKSGGHFRFSETVADGQALLDASRDLGLEGVMAKRNGSPYITDARSDTWCKIKFRSTEDCVILGYTAGQGDRSELFGSLHLAIQSDEGLKYMGRVGTGFDHTMMRLLMKQFKKLKELDRYVEGDVEKEKETIWIEPKIYCEIKYASLSSKGSFREPVFIKIKEGL